MPSVSIISTGFLKQAAVVAKGLGLNFRTAPRLSVEDGVEAVRNLLPRAWFDAENCRQGLRALKSYHRDFSERRQSYLPHPVHDWSSHAADALRTGAVTLKDKRNSVPPPRRSGTRRGASYMSQ